MAFKKISELDATESLNDGAVFPVVINGVTKKVSYATMKALTTNLEEVIGVDTDTFSTSSTYEVGDRVVYQKKLYECIVAIETPGVWDSTDWQEIVIIDELENIKSEIGDLEDILEELDVGGGVSGN